ncbi:MAG: ABC transporter ATP-binding protein [Candidatus Rokubacteria bacterium RIFCSPLOWO2_12_FULL_71_22]|nr:ABC transporter ATP-binding protein [Candidatus Rokubacteria bacterium]OGL12051.1 MAG: ABC transporter ATP-binding protein [Candidatus Rokubacteria bacterium RIFCSPLOWO2_02_FULL_72_37]OGL14695.1 MAG: ABC transporter ATP-binding protein [Candidatus Rokubacteria bacterium RIFCSPLOWO2_12_FULL_71_22]
MLKVASVETLYFDRIYALFGVSLEIEEGEIFTVLGPNGAGKTTLLRTIAGLLKDQPKKGEILFRGRRIDGWQPEAVARLGIVYVPEDRGLFRELTVAENLELGLWGRRDDGVRKDLDFVYGMFPILKERARQEAETLSGGEQQMLALGRAMLRRPRLLMLDEPSLGLAPRIARSVYDALGTISRTGTTILLVEQNARLALGVARRGAILEAGRVVLEGTSAEIQANENVREVYLGLGTEEAAVKGWRLYRKRRRW